MKLHELFNTPGRWVQGVYYIFEDGSEGSQPPVGEQEYQCCLYGGMAVCYGNRDVLAPLIQRFTKEYGKYPTSWNDAPARTLADIQAAAQVIDGWAQEMGIPEKSLQA